MGKKNDQEVNPLFITEADQYVFAQGSHYEIYNKMGAHLTEVDGKKGVYFSVWAPNAKYVNVVGSFNDWDIYKNNMTRLGDGGIFALFIPGVKEGDLYKFLITTPDGRKLYKADPYANYAQLRPNNASVVTDISNLKWSDAVWMKNRSTKDWNKEPISIYECHIGSWMKHPTEKGEGFYNYREFADRIIPYLLDMHYTHLELMGIAEHPFDGSWGYQVTGYYAPTSRYGTPKDFAYLIDQLHKNKIGVIIDWVPAHFPRDEFGLAEFDGTCLYEHPDPRRGEHPDWGTKIFNYAKNEVGNFLIANALFWVEKFHIDGIRVDAVASMLYLDYGKQDGQWLPNKYGDNKNLDAIEFFRHLNSIMNKRNPGVMTIAEESTAWPLVTGKAADGGLGFTFKWNMGWMHDFCEYMKLDPIMRKGDHYAMTFAMSYNNSEKYILPISHDEVVHLKCSMLNKMPGFYVDKFANLRAGYTYMYTHSGKKLLFMGQEFGQECEWSEARELEWHCLDDANHKGLQDYMRKLQEIYVKYPALHEIDDDWAGFEWINADDKENSVYSYIRHSSTGRNSIMVILNMTPIERKNYKVGVPKKKKYKVLLNSDEKKYGGQGKRMPAEFAAKAVASDGRDYSISVNLPPYGALLLVF